MDVVQYKQTPISLKKICIKLLVKYIFDQSFLIDEFANLEDDGNYSNAMYALQCLNSKPNLDLLILSAINQHQPNEANVLNGLKRAKNWWNESGWLGSPDSSLRRDAQNYIDRYIQQTGQYACFPLAQLSIQLCFTKSIGPLVGRADFCSDGSSHPSIKLELLKPDCIAYAHFLDSLGTFQIENLNHVNIVFASPEPLLVILKRSPNLKFINLRYNCSDYILDHIRKYCPKLETLILHDYFGKLMVSQNGLFEAFYSNRSKESVLQSLSKKEPVTVSFPNLKRVDLGFGKSAYLFYSTVPYFYPNLESLSCNSNNHDISVLKCPPPEVQREMLPFNISDITITFYELQFLDSEDIKAKFPNLKHITLNLSLPYMRTLSKHEVSRIEDVFVNCNFESLLLTFPLDSLDDQVLVDVFAPLLHRISSKIRVFQIQIYRPFYPQVFFHIFNQLSHLDSYSFKVGHGAIILPVNPYKIYPRCKPKLSIRSVSFINGEAEEDSLFATVCYFFTSWCPKVVAVELINSYFPKIMLYKLEKLPHMRLVETLSLFVYNGLTNDVLTIPSIKSTFKGLKRIFLLNNATFYKSDVDSQWCLGDHKIEVYRRDHAIIFFVGLGARFYKTITL